jgi:alkanesulfonate monooxygenase SsuD/methylene tetrahydromethanopterin reductase-like flavin-dependent oxidoreductase (luciferase family)
VLEWKGQWFDIPPRAILPKPLQSPHPPLWVAGTSEESHRIAGELGIGVLSFTILVPPEEMGRRIRLYREALREAKPKGKVVNPRAAVHTVVHCAKTSKEARKNAGDAFMNWASHYVQDIIAGFARWLDPQEPTYDYFKAFTGYAQDEIDFDFVNDNDMVIVGDPDECVQKVKRYVAEADMDHLICQMQFHGVPHEKVMESIELFGRHVIPQFS